MTALTYKGRTEDRWAQSQWLPEEGAWTHAAGTSGGGKAGVEQRSEEGQAGGAPGQTPDPREREGVGSMGLLPASQPASHPIQAGGEKFDAKGSPTHFSLSLLWIWVPLTLSHKLPSTPAFL